MPTSGDTKQIDGSGAAVWVAGLPWHHIISGQHTPDLNTGWGNLLGLAAGSYMGSCRYCTAQNNEVAWDLILAAGTWELTIVHTKSSDEGIFTASIDGTNLSPTVDCYNAGGLITGQSDAWTGITVATPGKKRVKVKSTSKNASSSGYVIALQSVELRRTA